MGIVTLININFYGKIKSVGSRVQFHGFRSVYSLFDSMGWAVTLPSQVSVSLPAL